MEPRALKMCAMVVPSRHFTCFLNEFAWCFISHLVHPDDDKVLDLSEPLQRVHEANKVTRDAYQFVVPHGL